MSNKTQNAKKAKTASEHNRFVLRLVLFFVLTLLICCFVIFSLTRREEADLNTCSGSSPKSQRLQCAVKLEYANTSPQRELGLSGRANMPSGTGMLFVFDNPARQCMWMKGMKFNLDMLWLDENNKAIKVIKNISPDTYPESFCADNTKYVVELNSGMAEKLGFGVGDLIQL